MPSYAIVFVVGAVLGTLLDQLHVRGGVLSYPRPLLLGQAAWVPLLFGVAAVSLGVLHRSLRRALRGPMELSTRGLVRDGGLFVIAYATSGFARVSSFALLSLFVLAYAVRVVVLREPRHRILHALACAAIGIVAESVLVTVGAFRHHVVDVWLVPFWLPGLYMHAAPFLGDLDDRAGAGNDERYRDSV